MNTREKSDRRFRIIDIRQFLKYNCDEDIQENREKGKNRLRKREFQQRQMGQ